MDAGVRQCAALRGITERPGNSRRALAVRFGLRLNAIDGGNAPRMRTLRRSVRQHLEYHAQAGAELREIDPDVDWDEVGRTTEQFAEIAELLSFLESVDDARDALAGAQLAEAAATSADAVELQDGLCSRSSARERAPGALTTSCRPALTRSIRRGEVPHVGTLLPQSA